MTRPHSPSIVPALVDVGAVENADNVESVSMGPVEDEVILGSLDPPGP